MGQGDFKGLNLKNSLYGEFPLPNPSNSLSSAISRLAYAPQYSPQPVPDGIWFNRKNGPAVRFSEPLTFPSSLYKALYAVAPGISRPDPGLYVILVADSSAYPRQFRPLYFGESGNMNERVATSHEHYDNWCRAAGGAENIRVAYCWMFGSTKEERVAVESALIEHYGPQCNTVFNWRSIGTPAVVPGVPSQNDSLAEMIRRLGF